MGGVQETQDFNKFDEEILDIDNIDGTDIKINPEFYIHNAILKAQNALVKDDMQQGMAQYKMLVRHIESIARASKMLIQEEYDKEIESFKKTEEYTAAESELAKTVRLAEKKIELIMGAIFASKTSTDPLKMGSKK